MPPTVRPRFFIILFIFTFTDALRKLMLVDTYNFLSQREVELFLFVINRLNSKGMLKEQTKHQYIHSDTVYTYNCKYIMTDKLGEEKAMFDIRPPL